MTTRSGRMAAHVKRPHFGVASLALGAVVVVAAVQRGEGSNVATYTIGPMGAVADNARLVIEAPELEDGELSPDNARILYTVIRRSVARNETTTELVMQALDQDLVPTESPLIVEKATRTRGQYYFGAQWCPDGTCVTYIAPKSPNANFLMAGTLMRYDLREKRAAPVPIRDVDSLSSAPNPRPRITSIGIGYRWAPSGKVVAFTAPLETIERTRPQVGVRIEGAGRNPGLTLSGPAAKQGVFSLDLETGRLQQLSPNTLDVKGFSWSPTSEEIAVAATRSNNDADSEITTDLFVINCATQAVRDVLVQPGDERNPLWSPDGRWIAVQTAFGSPTEDVSLGVVPSTGGPTIRLRAADFEDLVPTPDDNVSWMPDSRSFYYTTFSQMSRQLHRADIAEARIVSSPMDEDLGVKAVRFSPDRRWLISVRSGHSVPPELWARRLSGGPLKQLTHLSSGFPLSSRVTTERVSWPSHDGKFTIHGLLLTPNSPGARSEGLKTPLPTLVYVTGGPSMVTAQYDHNLNEILTLAAHGYAILIPNTRGRNGYGSAYAYSKGFPDATAHAHFPYEDVMTGVDYIVRRGIADATRLGIAGHSYGAYVTGYTVTQTHRFRGAVFYEGVDAQAVITSMERQPKSEKEKFNIAMGVRNPFAPDDLAKLIGASPAFNIHCIATPMLLAYGERTLPKERSAKMLFSGLQRFDIPVELVLYDEGHVISGPRAKADWSVRLAAWFDYWVRDLPYEDQELGKTYNA